MSIFMLESSEDSPLVILNAHSGKLKLSGRSIMVDPLPFQTTIMDWLRKHVSTSTQAYEIEIALEYINSESHKMLLHIMAELNKYYIFGRNIKVTWQSHNDDEYMKDVIQEFRESFDLPIKEAILV